MRLPGFTYALIAMATLAGAAILLMPSPEEEPVPQDIQAQKPESRPLPAALPTTGHWQEPAGAAGRETVRRIAPEAISAPVVRQAALVREAPRQPLSVTPGSSDESPQDWRYRLLFGPVVVASGRIEAAGYKLALSGIEPVSVDRTCKAEGKTVPCGRIARTAFRSWLRGRAVRCRVPRTVPDRELVSDCTVGGADLSSWLVKNGWAAATEPSFKEAETDAKHNRAGLHAFAAAQSAAAD